MKSHEFLCLKLPFLKILTNVGILTTMINGLDARDGPPEFIKGVYKRYQKLTLEAIQSDSAILDFRRGLSDEQQGKVRKIDGVSPSLIDAACAHLRLDEAYKVVTRSADVPVYEIGAIPGTP